MSGRAHCHPGKSSGQPERGRQPNGVGNPRGGSLAGKTIGLFLIAIVFVPIFEMIIWPLFVGS